MTIIEAVKKVLTDQSEGLLCSEIYDRIVKQDLYTFRAANPVSVVNGTIRSHCEGLDFPSSYPVKHFAIVGYEGSKPRYAINTSAKKETPNHTDVDSEMLPEELIQRAYEKHLSSIKDELIQVIFDNDPHFFEQLVVDLLIAMGYGYDKDSGIVVGGSHDGGIDGIVYEDKLGLDKIYLQAKRYKAGNTVGSKELQSFVGAMQSVQKGVFITTSSFTREAKVFAEHQQQKSLKLIDGNLLADLMIKHEIGIVKIGKPFVIYKLDNSYFG